VSAREGVGIIMIVIGVVLLVCRIDLSMARQSPLSGWDLPSQ
jgi:hypothetical protein